MTTATINALNRMPRRILLDRRGTPHEFITLADDEPSFQDFVDEEMASDERAKLPDRIRQLAAQIVEADDEDAINLARDLAAMVTTKPKGRVKIAPDADDVPATLGGKAKPVVAASHAGGVMGFSDWVDRNVLQG
jgi:hypothetical protein